MGFNQIPDYILSHVIQYFIPPHTLFGLDMNTIE